MHHLGLLLLYHTSQARDRSMQIFHLIHSLSIEVEYTAVGNAINLVLLGQGSAYQFRLRVIGKAGAGVGTDIPAGMLNSNGQSVRTRSIAHRAVWQAECQHIEHSALNDRKIAWRCWVSCPGDQLRLPTNLVN